VDDVTTLFDLTWVVYTETHWNFIIGHDDATCEEKISLSDYNASIFQDKWIHQVIKTTTSTNFFMAVVNCESDATVSYSIQYGTSRRCGDIHPVYVDFVFLLSIGLIVIACSLWGFVVNWRKKRRARLQMEHEIQMMREAAEMEQRKSDDNNFTRLDEAELSESQEMRISVDHAGVTLEEFDDNGIPVKKSYNRIVDRNEIVQNPT